MQRDLGLALDVGVRVLAAGGAALDAVVEAVAVLEDSRVFNAGRGSVLRSDGGVYLDASVMDGPTQRAGAVCLVRAVRNPVRLARVVLDRGEHVLLAGPPADALARDYGLPLEPPEYFITDYREEQLQRLRQRGGAELDHDVPSVAPAPAGEEGQTVGAVARDRLGNLAAATSTGGLTNAHPARVGDSPIIGAGTWAGEGTCAVSATGTGEVFIRSAFAHAVHARMRFGGAGLDQAVRAALDDVVRLGGRGGCVAVDAAGRVVTPFTTGAMPRAYQASDGQRHIHVLESPAP